MGKEWTGQHPTPFLFHTTKTVKSAVSTTGGEPLIVQGKVTRQVSINHFFCKRKVSRSGESNLRPSNSAHQTKPAHVKFHGYTYFMMAEKRKTENRRPTPSLENELHQKYFTPCTNERLYNKYSSVSTSEEWGEKLTGQHHPTSFLFHTTKDR